MLLLSTISILVAIAFNVIEQQSLAVPGIFKYPATLLCCGRKRRAECFVTTLALWVDLVTLQLVLLQVAAIAFVVSVAPFAVVTNVMLVVLALTCLANFLYSCIACIATVFIYKTARPAYI